MRDYGVALINDAEKVKNPQDTPSVFTKSTRSKSLYYQEHLLGSANPDELKPKKTSLVIFMFTMLLSGMSQGYTDYSNQAAALYEVHYGWTTP